MSNSKNDNNTLALLHFDNSNWENTGKAGANMIFTADNKAPTFAENAKFGARCLYFNGNYGYGTCIQNSAPSISAPFNVGNVFTIDFWARVDLTGGKAWNVFFMISPKSSRSDKFMLYNDQSTSTLAFAPAGSVSQNFNDHAWHHYAVTYNNRVVVLYYDGKQQFTKTVSYIPVSGDYIHFGGFWGNYSDLALFGAMDEIRISNVVRYNGNFTPNTFAYKEDNSGLILAKSPLNFTPATAVKSFDITGQEPEKTKRRLLWQVDGVWNKLTVTNGTAALTEVATQTPTVDSVLTEGNTVQEVQAATSIPPFVGKLVYPAIAMYADNNAVPPTIHVKANAETSTALYSYTEYSQEYNLIKDTFEAEAKNVTVTDIVADVVTEGQGNVDVSVSLKNGDTWSDYMPLIDAHMKQASALKLKAVYTVKEVGGKDAGHINSVKVTYTDGGSIVNGTSTDIVTCTQEFDNKLSYVHAHVKHNPLVDSDIKAYVALRETPKKRNMVQIANGTGAKETIKLEDNGINQNSIIVFVNGKQTLDFDYNIETSEITMTAEKGAAISASYEYGWNKTEWLEMSKTDTQHTEYGYYTTTYEYVIPSDKNYTVSTIKYSLERPTGHVELATIGTATGKRQVFRLPHIAKKETFVCNYPATYDYKNQTVTVIGDKDKDIVVSYDWIAESPHVYGIMAGWAD